MIKISHQSESAINLAACKEVQELLGGLHIASALYDEHGRCFAGCSSISEGKEICSQWEKCQHEFLRQWQDESNHLTPLEANCPEGYVMAVVPVHRGQGRRGVLLCCLKELRYHRSDALERICSQLQIDSTILIERGLKNAIGGESFSKALQVLLGRYIEKTQQNRAYADEMEVLNKSLSQSYQELALLHRISDRMRVTQEPEMFFAELCEDIKTVVDAEKMVVLWSDNEMVNGRINMVASQGDPELQRADLELLWRRTKDQADRSGGILIDNNSARSNGSEWGDTIRDIIAVPIRRSGQYLGALVALNKVEPGGFDANDTKLLISVANESAMYLDNFRLYRDLQDLLLGMLRALTSSIDAKDPYTCGHSERVALISRWLAERMSLSSVEVNNMYMAGLLHDVGKIGVSEAVLCKPGKLVRNEFEQIQKHPRIGADILRGIKQMEHVTPAVLSHHEHFDGSGYPERLSGRKIPLGGRIVMLADSFDAMISDRIYRKAMSQATVLAQLHRFSGTQFDPEIADVFLHADVDQLVGQLQSTGIGQAKPVSLYQHIMN